MKKLLFLAALILLTGKLHATSFPILRAGETITRGTIDPARLDHSSVAFKDEIRNSTSSKAFSLFITTGQSNIDGLNLFRSTGQVAIDGLNLFKSTGQVNIDGLNLFKSTGQTRIDTMETNFSTGFRANGSSTFTTVNANYFLGDGSKLTGILAGGGASTSSAITDLIITTAGADTNTYVFTATNIDIMGFYVINFATTAAMNKVGAGGTDGIVGDPTFTWVKFWAASNGSTCTVVITSGDVTIPTLPTGYTKWRLIGGGYNDGSSNLQPFYKRGNFVKYKVRRTFLNSVNPPESGLGTAADMTSYYPPWAVMVQLGYLGSSTVNSVSIGFRTLEDVTDITWVDALYDSFATDNVAGATSSRLGHQIFLSVQGIQTLYYRSISDCSSLRAAVGGYTEDFR